MSTVVDEGDDLLPSTQPRYISAAATPTTTDLPLSRISFTPTAPQPANSDGSGIAVRTSRPETPAARVDEGDDLIAESLPGEKTPRSVDPYKDKYDEMGDFMMMPSIRKDILKSPLAVLGMVASDKDSFEAILKKNNPEVKIEHSGPNLVMTDQGQKYVFRPGKFQMGDAIRMGIGGVAGGLGAAAAASLPVAALTAAGVGPAIAAALPEVGVGAATAAGIGLGAGSTALQAAALAKAREYSGGAPLSKWEILGALAIHSGIHTAGSVGSALLAPAESATAPAAEGAAVGFPISTSIPETTAVPPEASPAGISVPSQEAPPAGISAPSQEAPPAGVSAPPQEAPAAPGMYPGRSMQSFRDEARDIVDKATKSLDRSRQSAAVSKHIEDLLKAKQDAVAEAFKPIDEVMREQPTYNYKTLRRLDELERETGKIPPFLQNLRASLSPQAFEDAPTKFPPYGALDQAIKKSGAMLRKLEGPSPDTDVTTNMVSSVLGPMAEDRADNIKRVAPYLEGQLEHANNLFKEEKQLADDLKFAFGEKLKAGFSEDVMTKIGSSLNNLAEGSPSDFANTMASIPKPMRSDTFMSSFASHFGDAAAGEPIDLPGVNKWFKKTLGNEGSVKALMGNLDPTAKQAMKDIYTVSEMASGQKASLEMARDAAKVSLKDAQDRLAKASEASIYAQKSTQKAVQDNAKQALKGISRSVSTMSNEVEQYKESLRDARAAEASARSMVKDAEDRMKELAEQKLGPSLIRVGSSFGSFPGMGTTAIGELARGSKAFARTMADPAFKRFMMAHGIPKSGWQRWLESSMTGAIMNAPGRSGAPGKPDDSDLVKVGAQ